LKKLEESVPFELLTLWDEAREHILGRRFAQAVEIYKYILLMYPLDSEACQSAHACLAEVYLTMREVDDAKEHLRRALKDQPDRPALHYLLGLAYTLQNQLKRSLSEFEAALHERPENAEYLRALGWSTFNSGDREKGLLILIKALRIAPQEVRILNDLAVCYLGVADFCLARKYLRIALQCDPENTTARGALWMVDYAEHQAHMEEE
jgi:cellulose synthase operon protein C